MATKSKVQSKAQGTSTPNTVVKKTAPPPDKPAAKTEPATPSQGGESQQEAGAPDTSRATIRKGIYLSALIYIEGDLAPAANFADPATAALKTALNNALKGDHGGLTMTLKSVNVRNDIEQADAAGGGPKEGKFQF